MLADAWTCAARFAAGTGAELQLARCAPQECYPLLCPPPEVWVTQADGDLGARMGRLALAAAREGRDVLLLGTDAPALETQQLQGALDALQHSELVLGAVSDGGFWCLGLAARTCARLQDDWLDGLDWNQDGTLQPVLQRAQTLGLSTALATPHHDVDRVEDLPGLCARLTGTTGRAPATQRALESLIETAAFISVIVPTLEEGQNLDRCLAALAQQPGPLEIVVSDGGSVDGGPQRAARAGHTVLVGAPGRGRQLAAGAQLASGDVLLFLHVDTALPPDGLALVRAALAHADVEAGAFVTRTQADPSLSNPLGPLLRLADLRSRLTRHPYGDQAVFCTRDAYQAVGGLRALPIMEDYDLSVRLAARRSLARIREPVTVSGRRFQQAPLRSMLLMRAIPPLFRMGVNPERLARLYRKR